MHEILPHIKLGNAAFRRGSYEKALEHYLEVGVKTSPLSRVVEFNIALARKRLHGEPLENLSFPSDKRNHIPQGKPKDLPPETIFDSIFYLDQNPIAKQSNLSPEEHYYQFGEAEGRWPNRYFDPNYYLSIHKDVNDSCYSPFLHYIKHGHKERRKIIEVKGNKIHKSKSRGTFVLVTHDTDVGGAQHLVTLFAKWLLKSTRFDVQLVAVKGGNLRQYFEDLAPLLVMQDYAEHQQDRILAEWISPHTVGVLANSIASAGIIRYLPSSLPVVAFIHELPKLLDLYPEEISLLRSRASRIIGGGPDVYNALTKKYEISSEKVYESTSFIESLSATDSVKTRRRNARYGFNCHEETFVVIGCGVLHWRKSPDVFVEVAERVLSSGLDAQFIWIGGGPDEAKCKSLVSEKRLHGRVHFTGYEPQVPEKIAAGDLFLLSSQEDPYPLVALYAAQAGMPIVCFQNAGGIESFVAEGSGVATPFMDIDEMAQAVLAYAHNASNRDVAGRIGQQQVKRRHTDDVAGPSLLNHLREAAGIEPEVSVVVPNYNYEAYLPERLNSISAQTFQDFEVILLDDASCDGSARLLQDFVEMRPGSQILINSENSGSPFVQWMRGMDMARANLIWLAEADDRCMPDFLETMLPFFDDRNLRIASCASQPITADGENAGDYRLLYLDRINAGRWDKDYIATDHEEANAGLGIANSIPNASAVMFRKFTPEPEFVQELSSMRLCGDWYFYVRAMRGGLIGFSAKLMNDHRRHGSTVTHQLEGSLRYFDELAAVRNYLLITYNQTPTTLSRITEFLEQDTQRFNVPDPDSLAKAELPVKFLPSLLVVTPDLSPGGGQVFAISIANEWARIGGRVVLLNVINQPSHPAMLAKLAPEVTCIDADAPGADLATLIRRYDIDAIHSSIWWADRWVDNNRLALPADMPWVISMHGCYETILDNPGIDPSFPERVPRMIKRANWAYTASKNLKIFESHGKPERLFNILNGINEEPAYVNLRRQDVGLRDEAIVLCIASRAIASKGWFEAVRLTERLNHEGRAIDLLLIGEGPAADEIQSRAPRHVHLVGQVPNLQDYLGLADIGMLPSYFVGESLPLVLLEMMAKSLPLVASEIGSIPLIVGTGDDAIGLVVPQTSEGIDEDFLYYAVLELLDNQLRRDYAKKARDRFESLFTVQAMVSNYKPLYGIAPVQ